MNLDSSNRRLKNEENVARNQPFLIGRFFLHLVHRNRDRPLKSLLRKGLCGHYCVSKPILHIEVNFPFFNLPQMDHNAIWSAQSDSANARGCYCCWWGDQVSPKLNGTLSRNRFLSLAIIIKYCTKGEFSIIFVVILLYSTAFSVRDFFPGIFIEHDRFEELWIWKTRKIQSPVRNFCVCL